MDRKLHYGRYGAVITYILLLAPPLHLQNTDATPKLTNRSVGGYQQLSCPHSPRWHLATHLQLSFIHRWRDARSVSGLP